MRVIQELPLRILAYDFYLEACLKTRMILNGLEELILICRIIKFLELAVLYPGAVKPAGSEWICQRLVLRIPSMLICPLSAAPREL